MKVSIIIINYNTFQLTINCIESVLLHTKAIDYEVILVDNDSKECDPKLFLQRFPQITLIENKVNNGFAKGNNLGINQATGDYILLLNSDTYLTEDSISIAAKTFENTNSPIGALGVRMVFPNQDLQYSARSFRSISWELLDLLRFIPLAMPYQQRAKRMMGKYFKTDFSTYCNWVNGAFFMFPKALLNKLPENKLDERFFMYGEDQLWCYQFYQLGYFSYFLSTTTIVHIHNASTKANKQLQLILKMIKNELEIMRTRKGSGLYYYLFCLVYLSKEYSRYAIKYSILELRGKLIR